MKTSRPATRALLPAILFTAFSGALIAQTIEGTVVDPSGAPVIDVRVEVTGTSQRAWTDGTGRFRLTGLTPGSHTVRAFADDFEPVSASVTLAARETARVDLRFDALKRADTTVQVVGSAAETLKEVPGSVFLVSRDELANSAPMDANEILRRVPGLHLREDSGPAAMRLNIGIRGLNPDRSRRVLMLEDGVPISLAPYGEPEMYYSPPIDRMRKVEVLKGSGQIVHGPQTVGGVVNFVTPDPPASTHGEVNLEGGQRGFFAGQGSIGSSNRDQSAGYFLNFLHKQGDGFRDLYFDLDDVQGKFVLKPNDTHTFSIKLGLYDEKSNSTYLGLTTPMFLADPNQNPVPSDLLRVRRYSGSIGHNAALSPNLLWSSNVFAYATTRDWRRQDFDRADAGRNYLAIVGDPSIAGGALFLRDSALHRDRQFRVAGGQTGIAAEHSLFGMRNKLDAGIRYLYEEHDDAQRIAARFDSPSGVLRDDENRFGRAFSGYLQNRFFVTQKLILTPGVRFERYSYDRHILTAPVSGVPTAVNIRGGRAVDQVIPGLGVSYNFTPLFTVFAGAHRGFAPPRIKDTVTSTGFAIELDSELSWNYEAGVRFGPAKYLEGELTFFRLDFTNQIIPAAQSGGAATTLTNAGETLNQGVESRLRVNWSEFTTTSWLIYTDVRHTYIPVARFTRDALFLDSRLPYAPRNFSSILLGARQRTGFGFQVDGTFVGNQFSDNRQTVAPSADGTVGLIPSYWVWNSTVDYTVHKERFQIKPYFAIKNFTNELYISSRAPQGIQPGMFRQVNAGLRFLF